MPIVSLAAQCTKGVQYNWAKYLCPEFCTNYREAQEERKSFHYAWLLLSIVLVAWELWEDNQFPPLEKGLPKAVQFASLSATKDPACVTETKIFWVLMEVSLCMIVN